MDGRPWLLRGPLLSAAARPVAARLLVGSVVLIAAVGVLVAHHTHAGWPDRTVDSMFKTMLSGHHGLAQRLADLVEPVPVTLLVAAVALACVAARRLNGAVLAVVTVPAATGLTELLKRLFGRTLHGALVYPSGHATGAFALAAVVAILVLCQPRRMSPPHRTLGFALRLAAALAAMLVAVAVAAAVIGLSYHYFTDTVAGAAVGIGTAVGAAFVIDHAFRRATPATAKAAAEQPSPAQRPAEQPSPAGQPNSAQSASPEQPSSAQRLP